MRRLLKTLALGVLPVVSAVACTKQLAPPGELVIAVSTDVSIPKDIDTIRMQVISTGVTLYDQSFPIFPGGPAGVKIPATLGVLAGSNPDAPVLVRVIAISKQKALVLREATAQVPTDRTALLQLPLQWLSYGSAVDSDPLEPKAPDPALDGITEANCKTNETEVAGHCESDAVDTTKLPTFDPGLVFGGGEADGGGGKCFDTLGCFPSAGAAKLDMGDCTLPMPEAANASKINVAFMPGSGTGICNKTDCFVPVDSVPSDSDPNDGWTMKKGKIQLPIGFCDKIKQKGLVASVTVSTGCPSKTSQVPTCGPWSTEGNGGSVGGEDGGSADATVDVGTSDGSDRPPERDGSLPPEDASSADAGAGCLDIASFDYISSTVMPGVPPVPASTTLADGEYVLTSVVSYDGDGSCGDAGVPVPARGAFTISAGQATLDVQQQGQMAQCQGPFPESLFSYNVSGDGQSVSVTLGGDSCSSVDAASNSTTSVVGTFVRQAASDGGAPAKDAAPK